MIRIYPWTYLAVTAPGTGHAMIYTFMYFNSQVDQIHLKSGQNQHQIVMMLQCETVSKKIVRLIYKSQVWQPYVISQDVAKKSLGAISQSQQEVSHTEFKNSLLCTLTNHSKTFRQINMNNGDLTKCKLNSLVILNCEDFEFSRKVVVAWQISLIHHRTHLVQSVPNFTCWMGDAYVLILGHTLGNNLHLIYMKFKLFVPRLIYISVIYG